MGTSTVVGAGPGGLAAAYAAAKKGYQVTVYEKNPDLGVKPCGEGTLGDIAQYTPFHKFATQDFVISKFRKAQVWVNREYSTTLNIPVECYMLNKALFLEEFAESLGGYGVAIRKGTGPILWPHFVRANAEGPGDDVTIDATGFVRTSHFAQQDQNIIPLLRAYTQRNGVINDDEILIDIMPDGYFWIFPYGDSYNIGFGGDMDSQSVRSLLQQYIEHYKLETISRVDGAGMNVSGPSEHLVFGNVRLVGEGGGFCNPGTGEGIRFSMISGSLALEDDYEKRVWKACGKNLKRSVKIGKMLFSMNKEQIKALLEGASPEFVVALFDGKIPKMRDVARIARRHPDLVLKMFGA